MKLAFRQFFLLFLTGIILWGAAFLIERRSKEEPDIQKFVNNFEKTLHKFESEVEYLFSNASFLINAVNRELALDTIYSYEKMPYSILIYNDADSLLYWNNNRVQPYKSDYQFEKYSSRKIHEIAGSKYLMIKKPFEPFINEIPYKYSLIALIPLYLRFPINNSYLFNHFPIMGEKFSDFVEIALDKNGRAIKDSSNKEIFRLSAKEQIPYRNIVYWSYLLYFIAVLFYLAAAYRFSASIGKRYGFSSGLLFFLALITGFRLLTVYAEIPFSVRSLSGFQTRFPIDGELSWFYSLGDFLTDVFLFFCVAIFYTQQLRLQKIIRRSKIKKYAEIFFSFFFIIAGTSMIQVILKSIVFNPKIYFEFEDFSKIDLFTVLALPGVLTLLLSFYIISNKLIRKLSMYEIGNIEKFSALFLALSTVLIYSALSGHDIFRLLISLIFSVTLIFMLFLFSKDKQISFIWVSIWIFFFSLMATLILEKSNIEKSYFKNEKFLKELLQERDYELEEKILNLEKEIAKDEFFNVYLSSPYVPYSQVEERLSYLYLDNAFFGQYKYDINIYNAAGNAKRPEHTPFNELKQLLNISDKALSDNLYFYSEPTGRYVYWSIIPLMKGNIVSGTIAIKLTPIEKNDESSVYVELMGNSKENFTKTEEETAFAFYKNNQRVYSKNGNFSAFIAFNIALPEKGKTTKYKEYGKQYLAYRSPKNYIGIALLPIENPSKPFSIFSYLFSSGIVFVILLFILIRLIKLIFNSNIINIPLKVSLRERIQQGIVLVSLFSFIAIAIITIIYFQDEYNEYHKSRLERKIDSVAKTASWQILNSKDSVVLIPDAKELSSIHKIDVNIYGTDGQLLSSSEDAVFGRRLMSRQMNPAAFFRMGKDKLNKLTQSEKINSFTYLSGYVPLVDKNDQTVAFLNLPYDFAGNTNLQSQDVAQFLGTLLNVYVIFLMLAGIVALILANSVTRPLAIIGEKLRAIQLGGKNEKIDWKSRDEDISEFISRYNHMIEELDESTKELARTQRESAWREMARQVAHEIKNPLTPMKLQIQMLERAGDKDAEKARDMIKKVAKGLIVQIDILTNIANEFSNFAKMPAAKNENLILNELAEEVCSFFSEEENVSLELNLSDEKLMIFADKEQITRVLNNLIKNAIQAIPSERAGKVIVSLYRTAFYAVIKVSDNGTGIPEDRKDNIFTPYFTTKSSGTGIGLTMSKNIVESAKGQIYFQSKENIGTDFIVEIPLADAEN
jgi:two-component system, NtrC family, nitrogen regulation sensor histidine kinase NtrY